MSRLYTYHPNDNTALIEGLLSTALTDKGFEKHKGLPEKKAAIIKTAAALTSLKRLFGLAKVKEWQEAAKNPTNFANLQRDLLFESRFADSNVLRQMARQGQRDVQYQQIGHGDFNIVNPKFRMSHRHLDAIDPTGRLSKYIRLESPDVGGPIEDGRRIFPSDRQRKNGFNATHRDRSFERPGSGDLAFFEENLRNDRAPFASSPWDYMSKKIDLAHDNASGSVFSKRQAVELPSYSIRELSIMYRSGRITREEFIRRSSNLMYDEIKRRGMNRWYLPKTRIIPSGAEGYEAMDSDLAMAMSEMYPRRYKQLSQEYKDGVYKYEPIRKVRYLSEVPDGSGSTTIPGAIVTPIVRSGDSYFFYPEVIGHERGHRFIGDALSRFLHLPTTIAEKMFPERYIDAVLHKNPLSSALMNGDLLDEYLASSLASGGGYSKWSAELKAAYDTYLLNRVRRVVAGIPSVPDAYRKFLKGWGVQTPTW